MASSVNILCLDVGDRRVGLAVAALESLLPRPLTTLDKDENLWDALRSIIESENAKQLVIGLPRNLSGDDTPQTAKVRQFAEELAKQIDIEIIFQDEALSSKLAEEELRSRGITGDKKTVDALAAAYILRDYANETRRNDAKAI